jgi:hypothetical protein
MLFLIERSGPPAGRQSGHVILYPGSVIRDMIMPLHQGHVCVLPLDLYFRSQIQTQPAFLREIRTDFQSV